MPERHMLERTIPDFAWIARNGVGGRAMSGPALWAKGMHKSLPVLVGPGDWQKRHDKKSAVLNKKGAKAALFRLWGEHIQFSY